MRFNKLRPSLKTGEISQLKLASTALLVCCSLLTAVSTPGGSPPWRESASFFLPNGTAKHLQDGGRKFDEFTGANWESAMARLDNFAVNLQNQPNALGVVIVYGGQRRRPLEAKAWSSCLKDYLLKRRGLDSGRTRFIQGGYRVDLTVELWTVPMGQQVPAATATIKPSEVRFSGRKLTKWRRMCAL